MSEEKKVDGKDEVYDPRVEYEWVPMYLAVSITTAAILALFAPTLIYLVVDDITDPSVAKIIESLSNDNFTMIWIMVVGYWIGRGAAKNSVDKLKRSLILIQALISSLLSFSFLYPCSGIPADSTSAGHYP
jgi:hypothetical protein